MDWFCTGLHSICLWLDSGVNCNPVTGLCAFDLGSCYCKLDKEGDELNKAEVTRFTNFLGAIVQGASYDLQESVKHRASENGNRAVVAQILSDFLEQYSEMMENWKQQEKKDDDDKAMELVKILIHYPPKGVSYQDWHEWLKESKEMYLGDRVK